MRERVESVVKALVRHPEAVTVRSSERRSQLVYSVEVSPDDRGAILGRQGTTIRALETVIAAMCRAQGEPVRGIELCDERRD
jgi:predicted RNA-binding protein YlqC (UPF0109 family)